MLQDKIIETFVKVDNFCKIFEDEIQKIQIEAPQDVKTRNRKSGLCDSEIITLLISFHGGQFRNFKHLYVNYVQAHMEPEFPGLVSYNRFIELSHRCTLAFMLFIYHQCKGECTGISFIDSTILRVCHNKRIKRNKTFKGVAEVGKSTMGWFYGF